MMFRNSYRLLLANFASFWKDFLYKIIVVGIIILLTLPFFNLISSLTDYNQIITTGETLLSQAPFASLPDFLTNLQTLLALVISAYLELFAFNVFGGIYLSLIYFFVFPFLFNLSQLAVSEVVYGFMASQTKYSYVASFIRKLGKASVYSVFKTFISLAFFLLTFLGVYAILTLGTNGVLSMVYLPVLLLVFAILLYGFNITLFSGWAPSIIVFNCGAFRGLGKGMIAIFRRFFKAYSTVAMILLLFVMLSSLFGALALILLLPLLVQTLTIFQMVMLFGSQGMRYYVDTDTILSPKKLEETDKLKKVKHII